MKLDFSPIAQKALMIMEESFHHLFLTGKAGTGKSTLLEYFKENTQKKVALLAPTGIAALNISGETLHSFFKLKPGFELEEASKIKAEYLRDPRIYQKIETIVIDEISMVRSDLLDAIDIFLRNVRKSQMPFGGVQMIFIGDLFQLPPVVTREDKKSFCLRYQSPFFFGADVFVRSDFEVDFIELDKIYRQKDQHFIDILNHVRNNNISPEDLKILNERKKNIPQKENLIHLCTTNFQVNKINQTHLEKLQTEIFSFRAIIEGDVEPKYFPTDLEISVKVGAQVMFTQNDSERKWVNGTLGKIIDIDDTFEVFEVELDSGEVVEVEPKTWEISKYKLEDGNLTRVIIGSFTQFPLKLAWAITIHKSQGKTFDNVLLDLGSGAFSHGQTYVALSRCRSLQGLSLKRNILKSDIKLDPQIQDFLKEIQKKYSEKNFPQKKKIEILQDCVSQKSPAIIFTSDHKYLNILPLGLGEIFRNNQNIWVLKAQNLDTEKIFAIDVEKILTIDC